jgi:hypothetical protein
VIIEGDVYADFDSAYSTGIESICMPPVWIYLLQQNPLYFNLTKHKGLDKLCIIKKWSAEMSNKEKFKQVNRWMKKKIGLGGTIAHFVLREENGIYITTCGKANAEAKNFMDLTDQEIQLVACDEDARCRKCHFSSRSIKPWWNTQ